MINFANPDNVPKLQALIEAANKNDNSHFLDVPMGVSMITDVLFTSPILQGDDFGGAGAAGAADGTNGMTTDVLAGGAGAANAGGGLGQFGVDFENDPELAQALRISMDEERARQNEDGKADGATAGAPAAEAVPGAAAAQEPADGEDSHDEEYYIEQAKKLSMMGVGAEENAAAETPAADPAPEQQVDIKDVVNTDFMKDLVNDLGLDIEGDGLDGLVGGNNGEEEKKEEEKKDDPQDMMGGAGGIPDIPSAPIAPLEMPGGQTPDFMSGMGGAMPPQPMDLPQN